MSVSSGNMLAGLPDASAGEVFEDLLQLPGVRIERIVSQGQSTPEGAWYDQPQAEWVLLVAGSAALELEGEADHRILRPGDYLFLPPHCRHRVVWTDAGQPTVWLAVHIATVAGEVG